MNFIITVDPANIKHVFSRNFGNYGKGSNFHEMFEVLGDGIFNTDDTLWQYHRNLTHSFFGNPKFQSVLVDTIRDDIESRLIPLLNYVSNSNVEIDLKDVFIRFTFDNICTILMNHNPNFLSIDLPRLKFTIAIRNIEEVIFKRHLVPKFVWKPLRWLSVGEKKYKRDCQTVDNFLYMLIAKNREKRTRTTSINSKQVTDVSFDLVKYIDEGDTTTAPNKRGDKFLRDTMFSLILAGANTSSVAFSWFFYILSKYPHVTNKIRDELNTIMNFNEHNNKLLYLHAAICETLRLCPPVAFDHKASIKSDVLPSGHHLNPDMHIVFDMYAMGRLKSMGRRL
ncbi:Alkane hydroxylase MAH1 [Bienertia sinuspersici]